MHERDDADADCLSQISSISSLRFIVYTILSNMNFYILYVFGQVYLSYNKLLKLLWITLVGMF